jgi:type III pantothenate kinase
MILVVDAGNSRIKWGLHDGAWRGTGAVATARSARLAADWKKFATPEKILIANVAGRPVRRRLESILSRWPVVPVWLEAKRRECGVVNGYRDPSRLGADRWAALIGARALVAGPCLVVNAGTATTVDLLLGDGRFAGGAILPGLDLMKRSLAQGTAKLPLAEGRYSDTPRDTASAIETGCLLAQAGAIERMFAVLGPGAVCAISGGAAGAIAKRLRVPTRVVDNLVLEGLVRIAAESRS